MVINKKAEKISAFIYFKVSVVDDIKAFLLKMFNGIIARFKLFL